MALSQLQANIYNLDSVLEVSRRAPFMEVHRAGEYLSILHLFVVFLFHRPGRSVRTRDLSFLFIDEALLTNVPDTGSTKGVGAGRRERVSDK